MTVPSLLWTFPDSSFFAGELVCTIGVGGKGRFDAIYGGCTGVT